MATVQLGNPAAVDPQSRIALEAHPSGEHTTTLSAQASFAAVSDQLVVTETVSL